MAARFFDGQRAKPHPASLVVAEGAVTISDDSSGAVLARWALTTLRIATGAGGSITVRSRGASGVLALDDRLALAPLCAGTRRTPRGTPGWKLAGVACLAAFAIIAVLVDAAPDLLAPLVPRSWEEPLGRWSESAMLAGHRRCTGPAGQAALDGLLARLGQVSGLGSPVRITVTEDGTMNAFALPGQLIVLPRGMIDGVPDGDELAGVLAHELGHIQHRDATRAVLRSVGLELVAAGLGWGQLSGGGLAGGLASLSYGRAAEAQADAFAVATLRHAGLRADGLSRFLTGAGRGPDLPAFLSDHPASSDRHARTAAGPDGNPAFDAQQWQAVRSMCRPEDGHPI